MRSLLKKAARPLYAMAVRNPLSRAIVRRELAALGATSWSAHLLREFIESDVGVAYGLDRAGRERLVERFHANTRAIESGTSPLVHVMLAREILDIPPETKGDVVECGAWKGASSASLSLVCRITGRRLKVCDSFQGLPDDGGRLHKGLHTRVYGHYERGMFAGAREEVEANIRAHGDLEVCDFVEGFFEISLQALTGPVVFAFLDVDLEPSTRDCLRALWPRLVDDGALYCDDAGDLDVVRVYFDDPWWREHLGVPAPGLVGSGCGLPLSPTYSSIGYTRKLGTFVPEAWCKAPFLAYPETP